MSPTSARWRPRSGGRSEFLPICRVRNFASARWRAGVSILKSDRRSRSISIRRRAMRIVLFLPHREVFAVLKEGGLLLIDDGRLRLRIEKAAADSLMARVELGGRLTDRKGRERARRGAADRGFVDEGSRRSRPRAGTRRRLDRAVVRATAGRRGRGAQDRRRDAQACCRRSRNRRRWSGCTRSSNCPTL